MPLSAANQKERSDIIRRVGLYQGQKGSQATRYVTKIERECTSSDLDDQRCYVLAKTLNTQELEEWYYGLGEDIRKTNWGELKAQFLDIQQPALHQEELYRKWKTQRQLDHESVRDYASKLKLLCSQMEEDGFRPNKFQQTLHFKRGLKKSIQDKMKPRPQRYNDLEEAVAEAIIIDQDYSCSLPPSFERSLQKLTSSSSSFSSDDISAKEGENEDPPPSPKGTGGSAEKDDKIQKNDGIFSAAGKRMKINDPFGNLKKKRRLLLEEAEATNNNEKLLAAAAAAAVELILLLVGGRRQEDRSNNGGHDHESGTKRRVSFLEEENNAADTDGNDHDHLLRACESDSSNGDNDIRLPQINKRCNNGPLCRLHKQGLCVFDHSSNKASSKCRYGDKCKNAAKGICIFQH